MKVLFPRAPKMVRLFYETQKFETNGIRLEKGLHFMVASLVSQINGCGLLRRHRPVDGDSREPRDGEVQSAVGIRNESAPLRSGARGAGLHGGATRHKRVADATFETLRKHFSEPEIVEITWLNAVHNYYNLINVPLEIDSDGLCAIAQAQIASNGRLLNAAKSSA